MPAASLENKSILITGATAGIGKVAALELAQMGAQVTIIGRNPNKTPAVADEIRQQSHNPQVDYLLGDLSVMAEVRRLADEYRARHEHLHVLINNAAALFMRRQVSADGLEMSLALNYLAYFILTLELLDLLKACAPARIVNVTSSSHRIARLNLDDLAMDHLYIGLLAYGRSKLMNVVFTYELARRLKGSGVTANCLHPGLVSSDLGNNNSGLWRPAFNAYHYVAQRPEKGAECIVYLAASPELEGITGRYFSHKNAVKSSRASYDPAAGERLWQFSLKLAGRKGRISTPADIEKSGF
jgi:NAD(P)-dependent dehydrogenase (short-subunit alcohol dehydrogenase family)